MRVQRLQARTRGVQHPIMATRSGISSAERDAAAVLARAVAERFSHIAEQIETLADPRAEIEAVHRARAALRRMRPDTLARLNVLEAIHRGFEVQRVAMRSRPARAAVGPASLAVVAARVLYRDVAIPGSSLPDDPDVWAELIGIWQKGPGAPLKGVKNEKWDTLARSLTKRLGVAQIEGSTLKGQWLEWCKTADHLSRPKRRAGR